MTYDEIKKNLAPCGLNCMKCQRYNEGDIKRHSAELRRLLGSFDSYAERFSKFLAVYQNYPALKELLAHFSQASCKGCRQGDCKYPNCGVATCYPAPWHPPASAGGGKRLLATCTKESSRVSSSGRSRCSWEPPAPAGGGSTKQKGVDFCFQCNEFPCEKSNFDPNLHERWIRMNRRMKELGVEAYYEETKDQPRYA